MTATDDDTRLAAHLSRTLHAVAETVTDDSAAAPGPSRRRLPRFAFASAAVALAVGGLVVLQPFGTQDRSGWTADALEVAESAPRLLVTAEGWAITDADEFDVDSGQMTFAGPEGELELSWGTNGTTFDYDVRLFELAESVDRRPDVIVAGREAALFDYGGHFAALWREGAYGVEVRGLGPSVDEFLEIVGTIEQVDVTTWLEAMPAVVVSADARAAAVEEMLADIPLPEGLDPASLDPRSGAVTSRYDLGAHVTGHVACAWADQWISATKAGDSAAAGQAVEAMGTSRDWEILDEMNEEGEWPETVWEYADALATDGSIHAGMTILENGLPGLGCGRD
jgi:hypothetical protein